MGLLRTFYALSVVLYHAWPATFVFVGGQNAVQCFLHNFRISDFLHHRRTAHATAALGAFYLSRYLRLYPIYILVAGLSLAALLAVHEKSFLHVYQASPASAVALLVFSNLFLFGQDWVMFCAIQNHALVLVTNFNHSEVLLYQGQIIHPSWTLGIELSFYAIAPFVLPRRWLVFSLLAASLLLRLVFIHLGFGTRDPWSYRFFSDGARAVSRRCTGATDSSCRSAGDFELRCRARYATRRLIFLLAFSAAYFLIPLDEIYKRIVLLGVFAVLVPFHFSISAEASIRRLGRRTVVSHLHIPHAHAVGVRLCVEAAGSCGSAVDRRGVRDAHHRLFNLPESLRRPADRGASAPTAGAVLGSGGSGAGGGGGARDSRQSGGGMKVLRDAMLAAAAAILLLALFEGSLRFFGVRYDASVYRLDKELGYVPRPGAKGWSVKERESYERINSAGLRDREHALARPDGVIRIAVVGDSFAEAKQVAESDAFWSVMERSLNLALEKTGRRVEVLNFGVAGYGLSQDYLVIRDKLWRYDPQLVILTGTLHSLILHNSRKFPTGGAEGPVPYFELRDGALTLDQNTERQRAVFVAPSAWDDRMADWTNASRVLSLANAARRKLSAQMAMLRHAWHRSSDATVTDRPVDETYVLKGRATPDLDAAWALAEALLQRCSQTVAEHHAEFWFFLLDMAPQIDPDPAQRALTAQTLGERVDDLLLGDKMFARIAGRDGILYDALAPEMMSFAERNKVILHGFPHHPRNTGHWNEAGHALAGRLMAQRLLDCSPALNRERLGAAPSPEACGDGLVQPESMKHP